MFSGYIVYQKKGSTRINKFGEKVVCDGDYHIASKDLSTPGTFWYINPEVELVHPDFKILEEDGTITVSLPNSYSSKDFYCVKITRDKTHPELFLDKVEEYPLSFKKVNKTPYKIHKYVGASVKYYTKEEYRDLIKSGYKFKKTDKFSVLGINPMGDIYTEDSAKYNYEDDTFSGMDNYREVLCKPTSPMGIIVEDTIKYYPKWYRNLINNFVNAKTICSKINHAVDLLEATKEHISELTYANVDGEKFKLPFIKIWMTGPTETWHGLFDEGSYITLKETDDGIKFHVYTSCGSGYKRCFVDDVKTAMSRATMEFESHYVPGLGRKRDVRTIELRSEPSGFGGCKANYKAWEQFVNQWKADNHFKPKERFMYSIDDRPVNVYAYNEESALEKAKDFANKNNYKKVEKYKERFLMTTFNAQTNGINIV